MSNTKYSSWNGLDDSFFSYLAFLLTMITKQVDGPAFFF